ncbi:hypothetical protein Pfo_010747 [Paulownia fortunei]|nr:hypothetical protein Pfo_010747 [Paulownia fortunei]
MAALCRLLFLVIFTFLTLMLCHVNGGIPGKTQRLINKANKNGPYLGLVIPNLFEMNPLLQHPSYKPSNLIIDVAGRRFRFGAIAEEKVILVMTGLAMINAGITTQLLLSLFTVKGVVHYGIAGNANPSLNIGDVAIPHYWSHTALWNWQEVFPVDGTPEERQHVFWVPVDANYFQLSKKLKGLELENCMNSTTCLSSPPKVARVSRGASASIYLDNAAYRSFLYNKFRVSPQRVPFITFRAISDLAGGASAESNEADTFTPLAANNSVAVVVEFIKILGTLNSKPFSS